MFGVVKSPATIKKLVYVYEAALPSEGWLALKNLLAAEHFLQLNVLNTLKWEKIL